MCIRFLLSCVILACFDLCPRFLSYFAYNFFCDGCAMHGCNKFSVSKEIFQQHLSISNTGTSFNTKSPISLDLYVVKFAEITHKLAVQNYKTC